MEPTVPASPTSEASSSSPSTTPSASSSSSVYLESQAEVSGGGVGDAGPSSRAAPAALAAAEERRSAGSSRRLSTGSAAVALPESVLEAVAREAALSCATEQGPLAAGRTLACIFQVCSTWKAVSRSEFLWESIFAAVWSTAPRRRAGRSWRQEFVRAHATASNFLHGRSRHTVLNYGAAPSTPAASACRCLAISSNYLAGGFFDGTVRIFDLETKTCVRTLRSGREDRFGRFSRAITGIALGESGSLVFASLDGSIFTGSVAHGQRSSVHVGNIIEDGALISFAGSSSWWVGLYAGSPGRSLRVWNAVSREIVYSGGDVMNADAMRGWHSFVEQAGQIGRARISGDDLLLVTAARRRLCVYDLGAPGGVAVTVDDLAERNAVSAMEVKGDKLLTASYDGVARVRRLPTMEEICRVRHQGVGEQMQVFGTMNSRQLCLCISGSVNAWDVSSGEHLYSLEEQLGDVYDLVASDACLAACVSDSALHLWDFSP